MTFRTQLRVGALLFGVLVLGAGPGRADPTADEVEKLRQENKRLREELAEKDKTIKQLRKQIDRPKNHEELKELLRELKKEIEKLRREEPNLKGRVPAQTVRGQVTEVKDEKITISVGSDGGVQEGDVLQVYRLDPDPKKSLYLGEVKLLKVEPKRSVGRFNAKTKNAVKKGDEVSSSILPDRR